MRDLYRHIGLPGHTDDRTAIANAIQRCRSDRAAARAAEAILLDPERKAIYDRARNTLETIGQIRANLGLLRAQNWLASNCSDFDVMPSTRVARSRNPRVTSYTAKSKHSWFSLGIVILGCLFSIGFVGFFVSQVIREEASLPRIQRSGPGSYPSREVRSLNQRVAIPPGFVLEDREGRSPLDLPSTGVMRRTYTGMPVAPLEIRTTAGRNYYIKVVAYGTDREVLSAFIRGGEPFETTMPLGAFEIRYASGHQWYGYEEYFGAGTVYMRCDDRFDFTKDAAGYTGYTVELILQEDGNLETESMRPEDF
jgi:hypothetical protein